MVYSNLIALITQKIKLYTLYTKLYT